jgi:hypothetical protein
LLNARYVSRLSGNNPHQKRNRLRVRCVSTIAAERSLVALREPIVEPANVDGAGAFISLESNSARSPFPEFADRLHDD